MIDRSIPSSQIYWITSVVQFVPVEDPRDEDEKLERSRNMSPKVDLFF